jgi:hypothetical protein
MHTYIVTKLYHLEKINYLETSITYLSTKTLTVLR